MPQHLTLRELLTRLADALGQCGDDDYVAVVTNALASPDESLVAFLPLRKDYPIGGEPVQFTDAV